MKVKNSPKCKRSECFSNLNGRCSLLTGKIKNCTFFKTREQENQDQKKDDWYYKWLNKLNRTIKANKKHTSFSKD